MMQNIASQILSETPSSESAPVTATESSETETVPATPTEEKPQGNDDFDHRFGVLAKMERKLKEQEAQFKSRSKEFEDLQRKIQEYEEFNRLFEENPLEALKKKKGWGVQEFNEFAVKHVDDEDLDPVAKITKSYEQRMAELEQRLMSEMEAKIKAKEEEIVAKDHERQIVEFKSGIKSFLAENKDSYEFINAEEGGADYVYDLIYQDVLRQKESGVPDEKLRVMDVKEAAEKVESFLDKQYSKYLSLNKVKSKLTPSEESGLGKFISESAPKTLNSSFSPKSKSVDELSEEERKQRAMDLVKSWKTTA